MSDFVLSAPEGWANADHDTVMSDPDVYPMDDVDQITLQDDEGTANAGS